MTCTLALIRLDYCLVDRLIGTPPTKGGLMSIFDKAKDALNSEKAEQVSDQALDRAESFAKSKAGSEHHDKITGVRDSIDKKIGNE